MHSEMFIMFFFYPTSPPHVKLELWEPNLACENQAGSSHAQMFSQLLEEPCSLGASPQGISWSSALPRLSPAPSRSAVTTASIPESPALLLSSKWQSLSQVGSHQGSCPSCRQWYNLCKLLPLGRQARESL